MNLSSKYIKGVVNDMTIINEKYPDLESSSKFNGVNRFETFDISSFIKDKELAIEKVEVDEHIKLEARIVSDRTVYKDAKDAEANKDKIITLQVDNSVANDTNIVNIIGHTIKLNSLENKNAVVYSNNSLKVNIKDFTISQDKLEGYVQKSNLKTTDYKLSKLNQYKAFDSEKFLSVHEMKLLTIYPQSPTTARIVAIITNDNTQDDNNNNIGKTFSIRIEMSKVRNIPLELLFGNKSFTKDSLQGNISGMVVKNDQVLLVADEFSLNVSGKDYVIGLTNTDVNTDISSNANNHINTITSKEINTNANNDINNNTNNNIHNNGNRFKP